MSVGGCSSDTTGNGHTTTTSTGVSTTSTTAVTTSTTQSRPPSTTTQPPAPPRVDDGSLGNQATRVACRLLSRAQIRSQFGGPVSPATPTYPYCQWLVGVDAFLALSVEPGTSFDTATQYVDTLETITDLGQQAIIANNRYLYFTASGTSYWLLWQQVGDFSELHTNQLVALAHDVLAHDLAEVRAAAPVPGPPGPPIYFAGDSTAAGPEWAWDTYHVTSPQLRTLAEYQVGSGLVSPGYFDWARHLLAVVAARRPRLVIYMGSANDGQDLVVDGAVQPVGSPLWKKAYAARVSGIMASLVGAGAKVLWIGEPAMQDPELSEYMQVMDDVVAQQAAKHPGVTFFNPGLVLNGPHWSYAATRLIDGQATEVRLDGVHLNMAGSIYLANYIAAYVSRILGGGARARLASKRVAVQILEGAPRKG
jgi:lysophospholipase L1-like esterase